MRLQHAVVAQHDVLCDRSQRRVHQRRPLHGHFHRVGHQPDHGLERPLRVASCAGQHLLDAGRQSFVAPLEFLEQCRPLADALEPRALARPLHRAGGTAAAGSRPVPVRPPPAAGPGPTAARPPPSRPAWPPPLLGVLQLLPVQAFAGRSRHSRSVAPRSLRAACRAARFRSRTGSASFHAVEILRPQSFHVVPPAVELCQHARPRPRPVAARRVGDRRVGGLGGRQLLARVLQPVRDVVGTPGEQTPAATGTGRPPRPDPRRAAAHARWSIPGP